MILRPTPQDYDELLTVWEASVRSTHHFLAEKDIQFYKQHLDEFIAQSHKGGNFFFFVADDVNEQNGQACRFYQHLVFQVVSRDETDPTGKPFPILHLQLPTPPQITKIEHRL